MDVLIVQILVEGQRAQVHVVIAVSNNLDGHPQPKVCITEIVWVEAFCAIRLHSPFVHVAQDCVTHGSGEEISECVGVFEDDSRSWWDSG